MSDQYADFQQRILAILHNSGALLGIAALAALVITNAGGNAWYQHLAHLSLPVNLGPIAFEKSLQHWVNDGLMAVFFLLIGLELKREFLHGHLSSLDRVRVPVFAAVGGMLVPALIFLAINSGSSELTRGWAIPTATDIAFTLALLMIFGSRVPMGLKAFLLALAILDDLGAVLIIAVYYTTDLSLSALLSAAVCLGVLTLLNHLQVQKMWPYLLLGLPLWYFTLESGVHATVAGVALAATVPSRDKATQHDLLEQMEHALHGVVSYFIIPVFAFFNAGIYFMDTTVADLQQPLPFGIMLGLLLGKPIGICLFSALALRLRLGALPDGMNWPQLLGMSLLCGIGFTMSLFVGALAFAGDLPLQEASKIGILLGSLFSALAGLTILALTLPQRAADPAQP